MAGGYRLQAKNVLACVGRGQGREDSLVWGKTSVGLPARWSRKYLHCVWYKVCPQVCDPPKSKILEFSCFLSLRHSSTRSSSSRVGKAKLVLNSSPVSNHIALPSITSPLSWITTILKARRYAELHSFFCLAKPVSDCRCACVSIHIYECMRQVCHAPVVCFSWRSCGLFHYPRWSQAPYAECPLASILSFQAEAGHTATKLETTFPRLSYGWGSQVTHVTNLGQSEVSRRVHHLGHALTVEPGNLDSLLSLDSPMTNRGSRHLGYRDGTPLSRMLALNTLSPWMTLEGGAIYPF